jgi:abortive infection bacteriophage resistance protein
MVKPFLTYDQQIDKLINEKHLIITKPDTAKEILENIGYFALIGGYKTPFINPMTRIYENTSFDDIYALFKFDRALRELTFRYLCEIEQKMRQLISYNFCNQYGEQQIQYLTVSNYNLNKKSAQSISKLVSMLDYHANKNNDHAYLVYQRRVHHNVPLWVVTNALTFGQISTFYKLLPFKLQSNISKSYKYSNEKSLETYMKCLTLFRNVCAHNERLYNFRLQIDFPDTTLHRKLCIPRVGVQYIQGKRDYFGLVIAFRYLLSNQSFISYKHDLSKLITQYCKQSTRIDKTVLLATMGFPENWENITRYKP